MSDTYGALHSRGTLILLSLTHGIDHLIQLSLPVAILVSPFSFLEQTILLTVMGFMFGLGGLPAGFLADRIDARIVIFIYLVCASIGMVLAAISLNFLLSLAAQIIIGLGISLYHPAGTSLIAKVYPSGQRGRAMGVHGSIGNLIQSTAPFIASIIFFQFGWQQGYLVLAIAPIFFTLIYFIWWRLPHKFKPLQESIEPIIKESPLQTPEISLKKVLLAEGVLLALTISMLRGLYYQGVLAWMPTFFALNQTPEEAILLGPILSAGIKTTLMLLPGIFAQIIGGTLSDRYGWRVPLIGSVILAAISLVLLPILPTAILPIIAGAVFGFAFFGAQSVVNALLGDMTPKSKKGAIFGISFFLRFGIGSFATGMGGLIILYSGIDFVFPAMAVIALLGIPFILRLPDMKKHHEKQGQ